MNKSYSLCRDSVALFDLGHEGRWEISGEAAESALNHIISINITGIRTWRGSMGIVLTPEASVLAIVTVFRADKRFYVFSEASVVPQLNELLMREIPARGAVVSDLRDSHCWLSVVGPCAQDVMITAVGDDVVGLPFLSCEINQSLDAMVFRMGNTGEFEYRLLADSSKANVLLQTLEDAGKAFGIDHADPAVLNTLFLEMRSLTSSDIPAGTSPLEAGLHWMVNFRKEHLLGSEILHAHKSAPPRRCVAVSFEPTGPVVDAHSRLFIEDRDVGLLASIQYSPTLNRQVGVAYVEPDYAWVGVSFVARTVNGNALACAVSAPMFTTKTAKGAAA